MEVASNLYYDITVFCTQHVTRNDDNSFNIKGIYMCVNNKLERNEYKLLKVVDEGYVNL